MSYSIIDCDTHVTEPPDLWTSRAPAKMRDLVPRTVVREDGAIVWVIGDNVGHYPAGLNATAGRGSMRNPPKTYEDMHPGAYDAKARLAYQDQTGIWASVMYPNVGGFGGQEFLSLKDPALMIACVEMYNDWQTEWASADPRRLLPVTSLPFWDVNAAVKEVRRCAPMGHKALLFTGSPQSFGKPMLGDAYWNPLWEASVEFGLPISFHVGSGNMLEGMANNAILSYGRMAAFTKLTCDGFVANCMRLNDVLMSGILVRHPQLKVVSVESGIGWIPFALEALDYQFKGNSVREENPEFDRLPSEYFASNVYACYWFEQTAPGRLIDQIGEDNILFETDFPHPTCLYADEVHERIKGGLSDVPATVRRKILWENAQKLYKITGPSAADEKKQAEAARAS